ncbi:hypothetical protein O3P69_019593 [Scylla paramamosain]|uniref:Uncharacterized protein n=1 Tax=Scylla paramamosain TaxID=85552 RepID=A0AAW0SXC6_SCYPA
MQPRARDAPHAPPAPPRPSDSQFSNGNSFGWRGGGGAAFMSRARMGAGLVALPRPTPRAPDHDEAFVEESGIKLFESRRQEEQAAARKQGEGAQGEAAHDEADEAGEGYEEDPLYELDVLDDTIVEDDEEEDDDDDDKAKAKDAAPAPARVPPQDAPPAAELSTSLSSGLGSGRSSGSVSSGGGPASSGAAVNGKRDSCSSSGSSSRDSGVGDTAWPPPPEPLARARPLRLSLPPAARTHHHHFTIRRVAEAETAQAAPSAAQCYARRTTEYIDARLAERRSSDPAQAATQQPPRALTPVWLRRLPSDASSASSGKTQGGEGAQDSHKDSQTGRGSGGGGAGGQGEDGAPQHPTRPRSGTWSVATSRRVKIKAEKEEEASFRQRRKSGDDILTSGGAGVGIGVGAAGSGVATSRRKEGPQGFFDSFRPRSKSDARAILAARQRRKSGDDVLNASVKEKEKKKEAGPGFFDYLGRRPRSKSDASRVGRKPNIITSMKNAVQHTLVSPSSTRSGRRSGDVTPVEQSGGGDDVYYTWHAGSTHPALQARRPPDSTSRTGLSKVMELFRSHRGETTEERQRRKSGGVETDSSHSTSPPCCASPCLAVPAAVHGGGAWGAMERLGKPRSRSLDTATLQESGIGLLRLRLGRRCGERQDRDAKVSRATLLPPPNTARDVSPARRSSPRAVPRVPAAAHLPVVPSPPPAMCSGCHDRLWVNEAMLVSEMARANPRRYSLSPDSHHAAHLPCHRRPSAPPTPFMVDGMVQHFYSSEEWRAALEGAPPVGEPGPQPSREAPTPLLPSASPDHRRSFSTSEARPIPVPGLPRGLPPLSPTSSPGVSHGYPGQATPRPAPPRRVPARPH